MTLRKLCLLALAVIWLVVVAVPSTAQDDEKGAVQPADSAKYGSLPVLPSCMTFAVERGNPMSGPSLLLIKAESGCVVPWHWHSVREELMLVSGTGKIEMKGEAAQPMAKGAYVRLPARGHHQFTCQTKCLMFDDVAGAFDIHYVDKSGTEIQPDQAFKGVKETAGTGH